MPTQKLDSDAPKYNRSLHLGQCKAPLNLLTREGGSAAKLKGPQVAVSELNAKGHYANAAPR